MSTMRRRIIRIRFEKNQITTNIQENALLLIFYYDYIFNRPMNFNIYGHLQLYNIRPTFIILYYNTHTIKLMHNKLIFIPSISSSLRKRRLAITNQLL